MSTTKTNSLTATITGKTLAPYGIGEIIEVLTDSIWSDLADQVDEWLADTGAYGQVTVTFRDRDGDEVDIHDQI